MATGRTREGGKVPPFRCERFFHVNDQWYVSIREGDSLGPFFTKQDAEAALAIYVREKNMWGDLRTRSENKESFDS